MRSNRVMIGVEQPIRARHPLLSARSVLVPITSVPVWTNNQCETCPQ
jgi:hypothetical protein